MRYSTQVKPISYLKANAAEVLRTLAENRQPLIITQNGEARAVMQDLATYENTQETLALLKILALGMQQVEAGKTVAAGDAFAQIRGRLQSTGAAPPVARAKAKARVR
jgi:prevent-host-death family protein